MSPLYVKTGTPTTPADSSDAMQSDAPLKMPDACASLLEVREAIDILDAQLVALMAVRQAYIERAAKLRTKREEVGDRERIMEMLGKVIAEGKRTGLSAQIAEPVWRTLIEASVRHEIQAFEKR
jgi:isochorismate pyruvate lyase